MESYDEGESMEMGTIIIRSNNGFRLSQSNN